MPPTYAFQFMNRLRLLSCTAATFAMIAVTTQAESTSKNLPVLSDYLHLRAAEFEQISDSRQAELAKAASLIKKQLSMNENVQLNFICTHNSRRSHLAQIWTAVATNHFGIDKIVTFSGGTEATAMNSRIVAALQRAGLDVDRTHDSKDLSNPHYLVRYTSDQDPLECFSKVYNQPPNPKDAFVAILVCGNADRACPIVTGATDRLVIRYDDPKVSDNTPKEESTYDERCAQISREMIFLISQIAS